MNNTAQLRPRTVKLISRIIKPLVDEGVILVSEEQIMLKNLKHLADKGELAPVITPRLIDQKEAADMLGIGHSNFKKLEKEGHIPFPRKRLGSSVRYRLNQVIDYIMANDEE